MRNWLWFVEEAEEDEASLLRLARDQGCVERRAAGPVPEGNLRGVVPGDRLLLCRGQRALALLEVVAPRSPADPALPALDRFEVAGSPATTGLRVRALVLGGGTAQLLPRADLGFERSPRLKPFGTFFAAPELIEARLLAMQKHGRSGGAEALLAQPAQPVEAAPRRLLLRWGLLLLAAAGLGAGALLASGLVEGAAVLEAVRSRLSPPPPPPPPPPAPPPPPKPPPLRLLVPELRGAGSRWKKEQVRALAELLRDTAQLGRDDLAVLGPEQLEALQRRRGKGLGDLDRDSELELARAVHADRLVVGTLRRDGGGVLLTLRLLDVKSTLSLAREELRAADEAAVRALAPELVRRLLSPRAAPEAVVAPKAAPPAPSKSKRKGR